MNRDILKNSTLCGAKIITNSVYLVIWSCGFPTVYSLIRNFAIFCCVIGLDKSGYQVNSFLLLNENICCGYSLEVPQQGTSNEYPQHMFSSRNKKNVDTFW